MILLIKKKKNPKIAVEVLIGHGICHIIIETNTNIKTKEVKGIVQRIAGDINKDVLIVPQDENLFNNQRDKVRCGDNGIFKGVPLTIEQKEISKIARQIYNKYSYDGKYILDKGKLTICQSNTTSDELKKDFPNAVINPIGDWSGGVDTDTGATNRKLGSDMAESLTGGGIHGKDLSKADVTLNIYAFLKAQRIGKIVEFSCSIGDEIIDNKPYSDIVAEVKRYIDNIGGFEKFAEWGMF